MWCTGCAKIVLQFRTLHMMCRISSDVWRCSEWIQTVLNHPGETVTTREISIVYNSQHTWNSVFLKWYKMPVKTGATCFVSMRSDLLSVSSEAKASVEKMEVMCSEFYFLNCKVLAVIVWTKWDEGTKAKGDLILWLPLSSVQPVHRKHLMCIETSNLSWIAKTMWFGLFKFW